jgi:hypothetical protein
LGPNSTALQRTKVQDQANGLRRKIEAWRNIQALYIPSVTLLLDEAAKNAPVGAPELPVFEWPLWLPSTIERVPCNPKLQNFEWRLREAQAFEALDHIRHYLRVLSYNYKFKDKAVRGVAGNTRAQSKIQALRKKLQIQVQKYRAARNALKELAKRLEVVGWQARIPKLDDKDVRGMAVGEDGQTEGNRTLSWIWHMAPAKSEDDPGLHDG